MKSLTERYEYYLRIERVMSPNTVASYGRDVQAFMDYLDGKDPYAVSSDDVIDYFTGRKFLSKRSQARALSALRSFYSWLISEGEIEINPCDKVEAPKMGRYLPDVLSVEEVEAIIASVDTNSWKGLRDRAILEVLYGCGLRVSEASTLQLSDLFFEDGFVRVVGKGDKQRVIPMGDMAEEAIKAYLPVRPEPTDARTAETLFLNRFGKPLSRISIFNMVKDQAQKAGVTKDLSPHSFRHSFATHMIENGADLRAVQEMLGHESILTTEIYTHINAATWQASVLENHPRKK
ncbi:MAG: tyrosine recombinase XerD [Bacteroidales bacterium]|nr:tyrosine recombinase XerD [Candidatus Cryptobacteroides caccocaballi]